MHIIRQLKCFFFLPCMHFYLFLLIPKPKYEPFITHNTSTYRLTIVRPKDGCSHRLELEVQKSSFSWNGNTEIIHQIRLDLLSYVIFFMPAGVTELSCIICCETCMLKTVSGIRGLLTRTSHAPSALV